MAQYFGRKKSDGDNLQSNQVIIGLRIPHLENTRAALQTCKSEKSQLKTCRTKLETKIKNLEQEKQKTKKEVRKIDPVKYKAMDVNANNTEGNSQKSTSVTDSSSSLLIPSMVSHWSPNLNKLFYRPSDLSSMVSHCAMLPPPGSSLLSMKEVLEALDKAVDKLFASMRWNDSSKTDK